jgi:hypothetical protein
MYIEDRCSTSATTTQSSFPLSTWRWLRSASRTYEYPPTMCARHSAEPENCVVGAIMTRPAGGTLSLCWMSCGVRARNSVVVFLPWSASARRTHSGSISHDRSPNSMAMRGASPLNSSSSLGLRRRTHGQYGCGAGDGSEWNRRHATSKWSAL